MCTSKDDCITTGLIVFGAVFIVIFVCLIVGVTQSDDNNNHHDDRYKDDPNYGTVCQAQANAWYTANCVAIGGGCVVPSEVINYAEQYFIQTMCKFPEDSNNHGDDWDGSRHDDGPTADGFWIFFVCIIVIVIPLGCCIVYADSDYDWYGYSTINYN